MAYTHTQYEARVGVDISLATLGDKAKYTVGVVPHFIRAVALVFKTEPAAVGQVKVDKRPTAGSETGRGDGDIAVLNFAATHAIGEVVFVDNLNVQLLPGEEAVVEVTDLDAAVTAADVIFFVEPSWELPGNILAMKASV